MQYRDIVFPDGVRDLDNATHCRLLRFFPNSPAVILQDAEQTDRCLLLGDLSQIAPGLSFELQEQRVFLTEGAGDAELCLFCRVSIPQKNPEHAGFDTRHLIVVNMARGTGLGVDLPRGMIIPLMPGEKMSFGK